MPQFSIDECRLWLKNKQRNPRTNRKINPNAKNGIYKVLEQCTSFYNLDATDNVMTKEPSIDATNNVMTKEPFKVKLCVPTQCKKACEVKQHKRVCEICCEEYEKGIVCDNNHEFCKKCVITYAKLALEKNGKVSCLKTHCEAIFPNKKFHKTLQKKLERKQLLSCLKEFNYDTCNKCDYALELPPANEDNKIFICYNCNSSHCRLCKKSWFPDESNISHENKKCSELEITPEEKITEIITRKCPHCTVLLIKDGGCNKLTCNCGALICYVCRQNITKESYNHFCNCGENCSCGKCKIYDNTKEKDLLKVKAIDKNFKEDVLTLPRQQYRYHINYLEHHDYLLMDLLMRRRCV